MTPTKTICLALTGASGLPYGLRLLDCLLAAGWRVQLLYSQAAQVVARQEMGLELPSRPAEARAALQAQVQNQPVRAQLLHRDSYGRWLARLSMPQAQNLDVNAWLVAQGHAWDYQFANGKPGRYAALQTQAKLARRGLWSLHQPMQPRQFRRQHGACAYVQTARPKNQDAPPSWWQSAQARVIELLRGASKE